MTDQPSTGPQPAPSAASRPVPTDPHRPHQPQRPEVEAFNASILGITRGIEELPGKAGELIRLVQTLDGQVRRLTGEITRLQAASQSSPAELDRLNAVNAQLQADLEARNTELQRLGQANTGLTTHNGELVATLRERDSEIARLREESGRLLRELQEAKANRQLAASVRIEPEPRPAPEPAPPATGSESYVIPSRISFGEDDLPVPTPAVLGSYEEPDWIDWGQLDEAPQGAHPASAPPQQGYRIDAPTAYQPPVVERRPTHPVTPASGYDYESLSRGSATPPEGTPYRPDTEYRVHVDGVPQDYAPRLHPEYGDHTVLPGPAYPTEEVRPQRPSRQHYPSPAPRGYDERHPAPGDDPEPTRLRLPVTPTDRRPAPTSRPAQAPRVRRVEQVVEPEFLDDERPPARQQRPADQPRPGGQRRRPQPAPRTRLRDRVRGAFNDGDVLDADDDA